MNAYESGFRLGITKRALNVGASTIRRILLRWTREQGRMAAQLQGTTPGGKMLKLMGAMTQKTLTPEVLAAQPTPGIKDLVKTILGAPIGTRLAGALQFKPKDYQQVAAKAVKHLSQLREYGVF